MKRPRVLYALIPLMVLGWAANYIIGKIALRELPPLLVGGVRVTIAGVLMLPIYWWERRKTGDRPARSELPMLLLLGLFGVTLNQLLFVLGLSRTSAAHSAIFGNLSPMVVLLLAAAGRMEKLTPVKLAGMAIALAGVTMLQSLEAGRHGAGGPTLLGDVITFGGACAFAAFTVLGKTVTRQHSAVTVNTFAYVGGALMMAPITIWQAWQFPLGHVSLRAWASVFYMAAVASVMCYLIYYYALAYMPASRLAAYGYLQPPIAAVLGILILGEHITVALVVSMAVIFSGVLLSGRRR